MYHKNPPIATLPDETVHSKLEKLLYIAYSTSKAYTGDIMPLIDEIKKKTEEGLKTLRETAQDIAFNVEKQAKIGKKKLFDIARLQRNIQKVYSEIGEYTYEEFTSNRPVAMNDAFIKERINYITQLKEEIKDIEEEIHAIEHTLPPKRE